MAKTIREMGIVAYLDDVYAKEGGYSRFRDTTSRWPRQQCANEYGISRQTLNQWIKLMEKEENEATTI